MNTTPHRCIAASAGTGKTFRLAHRYIALLARGDVSPDRICALTFSRKAAGEIFDTIVDRLCDAAECADRRAETAQIAAEEELSDPPRDAAAYRTMLRSVLDCTHRVRIGTLDSFLLGIVRAFPLELGIPPGIRPMDGDGGEASAARAEILARIFDPTRREEDAETFLRGFRLAQAGRDTKRFGELLDGLVTGQYDFYRAHAGAVWGEIDAVWPVRERWWEAAGRVPADLPEQLSAALTGAPVAEKVAALARAAMAHAENRPWPDEADGTIFERLFAQCRETAAPVIVYNRKSYAIPAGLWPGLRAALANLVAVEIRRTLAQARGRRAVLEQYDQLYADALRTTGRFTFDDVARLLGPDGMEPSRNPDAEDRLYIDYRLDGKLDHWLLDEFQDTSDTQWGALANLVDELVQSDDGSRTFFYVGDVKQSIYGWRGGNPRLFGEILAKYGGRVASQSISECFRSLPAVIRAVNGVFDGLERWTPAAGADKGPRADAVSAFAAAWQPHVSGVKGRGDGFASLLEYTPDARGGAGEGDEEAAEPAAYRAVAELLRRIQPHRRGLGAAVLVRSNEEGRACVDALRRLVPDIPALHEGKGGIVDNPVVNLLLALVRYAAHPGDTFALRHLQMSPLARTPELADPEALPELVLDRIQDAGFAELLREWGARLGPLDPFGRQRLDELLAAAEQFDAGDTRDPDLFLDCMAAHQVRPAAAAGTVRVMTIHQSKGLGFDLTIVPFGTAGRSFGKPGDPGMLASDDWVLVPPIEAVLEAAGGRPLAVREAARVEANLAQLCVLYVALTRARKALYMVVPARSARARSGASPQKWVVREADLLRERLCGVTADGEADEAEAPEVLRPIYATGDPDWYLAEAPAAAEPEAVPAPVPVTFVEDVPRREPSKEHGDTRVFPAAREFLVESGDVLAFGSAIHRLFEQIEWGEDADVEAIVRAWRAGAAEPLDVLRDVERQFRECMASTAIRAALARPAGVGGGHADVWREAPFNLVLEFDGTRQLLGGRFDRLVVERDAKGRPLRATVYDYKSNRVAGEAEMQAAASGYAGQMADYARAAGRLLGLPTDKVATVLVFTRTARLWPLGRHA